MFNVDHNRLELELWSRYTPGVLNPSFELQSSVFPCRTACGHWPQNLSCLFCTILITQFGVVYYLSCDLPVWTCICMKTLSQKQSAFSHL